MIRRIDHVGIAVRRLAERTPFWRDVLGMELTQTEEIASEGVRAAFLPVGESRLEILEPTRDDSPIARFIERRGEGLHQIALAVPDASEVLARVRDRGLPLLDEATRPGAAGSRVAFLHPKATGGVLVELVEDRRSGLGAGPLRPGMPVIAYLRDPGEKLWGLLRDLDEAGVTVEGLDLGSFEDWAAQVERGERGAVGPSVVFLPMRRVEKILADGRSGDLPSLAERFESRTGRSVASVLAG